MGESPKSKFQNLKSLPPPQFGLRSLMLVVTVCAALAALSQWVSPMALAAVVMLVLCIIAHVAGNSIGTKLRELGSRPHNDDPNASGSIAKPKKTDFAPATRLGQRYALGWPIVIATLGGTILGGIGGGVWTLIASRGPVGPLNVGVGCVAFAMLGGLAAFLAFGFVQVGLGAIRQTMSPSDDPAAHRADLR
jgi:hypothetical protein